MLRLPDGMRERLADIAKANGRSMNSEIVLRLSMTLDHPNLSPAEMRVVERMEIIERQNREILERQAELMLDILKAKKPD